MGFLLKFWFLKMGETFFLKRRDRFVSFLKTGDVFAVWARRCLDAFSFVFWTCFEFRHEGHWIFKRA